MAYDDSKYRQGYSIGVGGVVLYGDKVLLVRRALGSRVGDWALPGGFVERDETIDVAAQREVLEEAGVQAEIEGLLAVRNRIDEDENSAYFMFLLRAQDETTQPDGFEVDDARFFTLAELDNLPGLQTLSHIVITKTLKGEAKVLTFHKNPNYSAKDYIIYT